MKPAFDQALALVFNDEKDRVAGHSGRVQVQGRVLDFLASQPWVHPVCETSFNAGHSAFNFLTSNPKVVLQSFDTAM